MIISHRYGFHERVTGLDRNVQITALDILLFRFLIQFSYMTNPPALYQNIKNQPEILKHYSLRNHTPGFQSQNQKVRGKMELKRDEE